eukprot:TRINITY_DN6435_c0_g1_i1.p2 TRINITY_DN6435_c0_g1~~TRINITY_DN6435_c0_g1_i1.p2  ORF type:complete len:163 (-),score=53.59 TRINITY_DN6435_c0_g1_i1:87-575(-)
MYQILFNSHYLSFFLHALQDFYTCEVLLDLQRRQGLRMNVVHLDGLRFLASAMMGDHLTVLSTVAERTDRTLTWYCACHPSGGGQLLADALITVAFFDTTGAEVPLPPVITERVHPEGKVMIKGILRKRSPLPGAASRVEVTPAWPGWTAWTRRGAWTRPSC